MESNYRYYDFLRSIDRIKEILDAPSGNFEEADEIPPRGDLTFTNGFYVNCTALFVDMRGSSTLPEKHTRPVLAKIYRSYISEAVAIMNGSPNCAEVNIIGDCVSGIFNTPKKSDIDESFSTAAQIASMVDILNCKLEKKGYSNVDIGIGMEWGRALMIKAGYSGSGINDVVWMGDVVNKASKLCGRASKFGNYRLLVSADVHFNLNDRYQELLSYNTQEDCYHGYIINTEMEQWRSKNC